jgi:hypothetical protein
VFSCDTPPPPDRDFEHPYEPLVLALIAAWTRMTREDRSAEHAILLAPPLVDLTWPLQPSQPHINPSRRPV